MKLIKKHIFADEEGRLKLPLELIKMADIKPGSELEITLIIPEDGMLPCPFMVVSSNAPVVFEFALGCEAEEDGEPEDDFSLPKALLLAAGISPDSDLEVTCIPGTITIKESDILNRLPESLSSLFQSFGINPENVREVMKKEGYFI